MLLEFNINKFILQSKNPSPPFRCRKIILYNFMRKFAKTKRQNKRVAQLYTKHIISIFLPIHPLEFLTLFLVVFTKEWG